MHVRSARNMLINLVKDNHDRSLINLWMISELYMHVGQMGSRIK